MASLAIQEYYRSPGTRSASLLERHLVTDGRYNRSAKAKVTIDTGLRAGVKVETTEPELPPSLLAAISRIQEFERRPRGWNSYDGASLNDDVVQPGLELIVESEKMCQAPRLQLASHGGLDLVWESPARFLEISVWPDKTCEIFFRDEVTGEEFEPEEHVSTAVAIEQLKRFCSVG